MAWYRAGTATFTNGSKNVTGTGTAWATNVRPGDEIIGPDNISREVETVTSDTTLTMVEAYAGATAAGAAYKVKPIQGWNRDVAAQLAALINDYGSIEAALTAVAGSVGIGTLTPQSALSVATIGDAAAASFGEAGSPTGKVLSLGYFATSDYGRIQAVHQGTGFKALALNPSGGNVGIGTSAPSHKLDVAGRARIGGNLNSDTDAAVVLDGGAVAICGQTTQLFKAQVEVDGGAMYLNANQYYSGSWQLFDTARAPAQIALEVGNGGSSIYFGTKNANSGGTVERMRIKPTGQIRLVPLAADPASAAAGDMYFNSTTSKFRGYTGGAWVDLH